MDLKGHGTHDAQLMKYSIRPFPLRFSVWGYLSFTALLGLSLLCHIWQLCSNSADGLVGRVEQCSIRTLNRNLSFLDNAHPIAAEEFIHRRDNLAKALATAGVDCFVLEPGYTFQYYANVSQTDWEPWEPEERPFLMVVEPVTNKSNGEIRARTSFLSPKFEEGRVRMLGIPSVEDLNVVTWEEHWNPYKTLRESLFSELDSVTLMVDEEMREFLVRGLAENGFDIVGLSADVEAIRQIKSPAEVELLRAVNTGTVEALRAVRSCLAPGLTEN